APTTHWPQWRSRTDVPRGTSRTPVTAGGSLMLVLSRRCRETIVLPGDGVTIRVLEIRSNRVRLGIEAPSGVSVLRGELICDVEGSDEEAASHRGPRNGTSTREESGLRARPRAAMVTA